MHYDERVDNNESEQNMNLEFKETYLVDLELILDNLKLTNNERAFDYLDTVIKCIKKDNNITN